MHSGYICYRTTLIIERSRAVIPLKSTTDVCTIFVTGLCTHTVSTEVFHHEADQELQNISHIKHKRSSLLEIVAIRRGSIPHSEAQCTRIHYRSFRNRSVLKLYENLLPRNPRRFSGPRLVVCLPIKLKEKNCARRNVTFVHIQNKNILGARLIGMYMVIAILLRWTA